MKKNNNINKNLDINSFTNINLNYKKLPSSLLTFNTTYNIVSIDNSQDMPKNYEEVNDYSFLNVITEEITNLENFSDCKELQEILTSSLDTNNNLHKNFSDKDFNYIIQSLNSNEYRALLHQVNYFSFLEIIDSSNDNSYRLQLNDNGIYKVGETTLDNLLTYLIETNTYKN